MSTITTDQEDLNSARNRALYDGHKNSIVEWTLSDEWTHVDGKSEKQPRGLVKTQGFLVTTNACAGEINAA